MEAETLVVKKGPSRFLRAKARYPLSMGLMLKHKFEIKKRDYYLLLNCMSSFPTKSIEPLYKVSLRPTHTGEVTQSDVWLILDSLLDVSSKVFTV